MCYSDILIFFSFAIGMISFRMAFEASSCSDSQLLTYIDEEEEEGEDDDEDQREDGYSKVKNRRKDVVTPSKEQRSDGRVETSKMTVSMDSSIVSGMESDAEPVYSRIRSKSAAREYLSLCSVSITRNLEGMEHCDSDYH